MLLQMRIFPCFLGRATVSPGWWYHRTNTWILNHLEEYEKRKKNVNTPSFQRVKILRRHKCEMIIITTKWLDCWNLRKKTVKICSIASHWFTWKMSEMHKNHTTASAFSLLYLSNKAFCFAINTHSKHSHRHHARKTDAFKARRLLLRLPSA